MTPLMLGLTILLIVSFISQTLMASVYMSTVKRYISPKRIKFRKIVYLVSVLTPGTEFLLLGFLMLRTMYECVNEEFNKAEDK